MPNLDIARSNEGDTVVESDEPEAQAAAANAADAARGATPGATSEPIPESLPGSLPESTPAPARKKRLGPGAKLKDAELDQELAALLFASPDPLSLDRLQDLLLRPEAERVEAGLERLAQRFKRAKLPYVLESIAGGWRILTSPDLAEVVLRLAKARKAEKITPAGLETLAIVAYRQPVTNGEVEAIRGVQSGSMLRALVDRGLAKVTGRADQPGSPLQYGTTKEFLDKFGLGSLKDLPRDGELTQE